MSFAHLRPLILAGWMALWSSSSRGALKSWSTGRRYLELATFLVLSLVCKLGCGSTAVSLDRHFRLSMVLADAMILIGGILRGVNEDLR